MENFDYIKENFSFLYSLGLTKKRKENFLSDALWALCHTDKNVLHDFFRFCFKNESKIINLYSITREEDQKENGRNDFFIYTDKGRFIVESKIDDQDINKYKKYLNTLNDENTRLAYIVPKNYEVSKIEELGKNNICVVAWEDFLEKINQKYDTTNHKQFVILAKSVLGINHPLANDSETEDMKLLLDCFVADHASFFYKKESDLCWYGNKLKRGDIGFWVMECPFKGKFFAISIKFNIGDIDKDKSEKIYETQLNRLAPLGDYFRDGYKYFEIINFDGETMTSNCLNLAFEEFANKIYVFDKNKSQPLIDWLKNNYS